MKSKILAVFDTNIFISAIIFGGNPRTCLELAREGKIRLYSSKNILLEVSQKLSDKFMWKEGDIKEVIRGIGGFATIVTPNIIINKIKKDEADNRILECTFFAKADYIVSGDKHHLLSIKKFKKIPIVTSTKFIKKVLNP